MKIKVKKHKLIYFLDGFFLKGGGGSYLWLLISSNWFLLWCTHVFICALVSRRSFRAQFTSFYWTADDFASSTLLAYQVYQRSALPFRSAITMGVVIRDHPNGWTGRVSSNPIRHSADRYSFNRQYPRSSKKFINYYDCKCFAPVN